jgi:hypothetical protein
VAAGGRVFERPLAAGCEPAQVEVEVVVPAWQPCTVRLPGAAPEAQLYVELAGADQLQPQRQPAGAGDEVRFQVVFPGRYEVHASAWPNGLEVRWSETLALEVVPENPARVTLELREP